MTVNQTSNQVNGPARPETESARGHLQPGRLVGREFELAHLQEALTHTLDGRGRLVLITGPAGVGKMRLVRELRRRAQEQSVLVCESVCDEHTRAPYRPWVSIVSQVLAYQEACGLEGWQTLGAPLTRLLPELAGQVGRMAGGEELADKQKLIEAVARLMSACDRPLMLILEDLQYADAETIELLDALGQRAAEGRVLLCGVYRDDELDDAHPLNDLARKARLISRQGETPTRSPEQPYDMFHLEALTEADTATLVRSMLGTEDLPPGLVPRLMVETGGNPLFVESIMRSLAEEGLLRYDGERWRVDVASLERLPANIQEAAQRRLARLDPESLALLQWASLMTQWLDVDVLLDVCGFVPDRMFHVLEDAVQRRVLMTGEQAGRRMYRFSDDPMRVAVYNTLTPQQRAQRHLLIGETLRKLYSEAEVAESLAWHFERAGEPGLALRYSSLAADKARRVYANELAIQHYGQALALLRRHASLADPVLEYDLLAGREDCYRLVGQRPAQQADLDAMARIARSLGDVGRQIQVFTRQVALANQLGQHAEALRAAEAALALSQQAGERQWEADSLTSIGEACYRLGDSTRAYASHAQALDLYRELGDHSGQANSLRLLGRVTYRMGETTRPLEYYQQALAIYRRLGDRQGEASVLNALGVSSTDRAQARTYYEQSLAIAQAIGDRAGQGRAYNNLALTYWSLGLYGRARDYLEQAVEIERDMQGRSSLAYYLESLGRVYLELDDLARSALVLEEGLALAIDIGDRWVESSYRLALGRVCLAQGRWNEAREWIQAACDIQRALGTPGDLATSLAWLGRTWLELGDWEAAHRCTTEAVAHLEAAGGAGDYMIQDVWWAHYLVLRAALGEGQPLSEAAWTCLRRARDAMLSAVATLSDEGLRRNYLNKVKINKDILAEWAHQAARWPAELPVPEPPPAPARPDAAAEAERIRDRLRRLLDVSVQMNEPRDAGSLLEFVMDQVIELSGAERGFVALVDRAGHMDFHAVRGVPPDEIERARTQAGYAVLGQVARSKTPVLLQDARADERRGEPGEPSELDLRSIMCVPLLSRSELIGLIYADNRSVSGRFTQADVDLLTLLANQAAAAIENVRLYEETAAWAHTLEQRVAERTAELQRANQAEQERRRLAESLAQIGRELSSSLDLAQVPGLILEQLAQVMPYERCSVILEQGKVMRIAAQRGFPEDERTQELRIVIREGDVFQQMLRTRSPVLVEDVTQVPGWQLVDWLPLNKSWLGVPLMIQDRVIGMMSMTRREAAAFSQDDARLVSAFAGQAAVALENARLYAELDRAYRTLERLDRTKTNFISVAAHELRTPLTVIKGYAQVMQSLPSVKGDPQTQPLLDGLLAGMARMHEIVNSVLDVTKIDAQTLSVRKEPVMLLDTVERVRTELEAALQERRLTLTTSGLVGLPLLEADPDLLYKVFYHLLINAIKYTPDGGSIWVSAALIEKEHEVEIVVADNGIGIDPEHHELIFEKFYQTGEVAVHSSGRTKFKGGGPGLGLAIVRGIVLAHGGRVWVESEGHDEQRCPGSRFYIRLPV